MRRLKTVSGGVTPLPRDHVDTDQIVPARFLTRPPGADLGDALFADWRQGESAHGFPLDNPRFADSRILVAGENFGCGSSREHAAWALRDYGFEAVVSSGFADIFRGNALRNGVLPVEISTGFARDLMAAALAEKGAEVEIDLRDLTLSWGDRLESFEIEPLGRRCLLEGKDALDLLLEAAAARRAYETQIPDWRGPDLRHLPIEGRSR